MEISQRFQRKLSTVWESRQAAISAATNQQCLLLHSDGHSESQTTTKSKSEISAFYQLWQPRKRTKQNQQEKNTDIFNNGYFPQFRNQEKTESTITKTIAISI